MRTILSQCVAGLQQVALRALQSDLEGVEAVRVEEGMVVYRTSDSFSKVRSLPYLNNSFSTLYTVADGRAQTMDGALRSILQDRLVGPAVRASSGRGERSFRLFLSDENELVSGAPASVSQLRNLVQTATGLRFAAARADAEYWVLRRRSGAAYLLKRLTQRTRTEKDLARGELRPELAHLLCRLSDPEAGDVFMDPFAGSGALPFARIHYPYSLVYAFDSDPDAVAAIKARRKALPAAERSRAEKLIVREADALALERIDDGFVHKVVTDPPWGAYRDLDDPESFYASALRELVRITRQGGIIVLLTAAREALEAAVSAQSDRVRLEERHELLVAGKKAAAYRLRRTSAEASAVEGTRRLLGRDSLSRVGAREDH